MKDVLACLSDQLENFILNMLKLPLEVRKLNDKLVILLFKFRSLELDHLDQHLIFKALRGDCKVDQGDLDANFRQVVGVRELGRDEELEVTGVGDGVTADLDAVLTVALKDLLRKDRLHLRINNLLDVLKKDRVAISDAGLNPSHVLAVTELDNL